MPEMKTNNCLLRFETAVGRGPIGRRLQAYVFSFISLVVFAAVLGLSVVAQTTVTVNQTSAAGWLFYNDETDVIDPTLGAFVNGPATAPLGTGSAQISVSGTQRRNLATYQFSGTPLANITTLRYSTYNPSAGNGGSATRAGYLQFNVDFNGSDTWQRRLVFVPSSNGTVVQDTWQEWDAISSGNALWGHSGATWPAGIGGGGEPGTFLKTWSQVLSQYPSVRIRVTDAFFGIRVGEPYADGYTENIDLIKFGTGAGTTHFDFEPATALAVSPVGAPNPLDNDYTRINNAVQAIASGGTITLNGTFNWSEANAAASWALGSDGQTGGAFSNDDYSILAPGGLNGVTVTASSLGAATIQGPGDLAAVNLEGVFQFFSGGLNQNWTISNLRFLDFDNAIGFYYNGGPVTVYNGTQIVNNYIRTARDLNATVAPADVNQNIGIHYSFGDNILISGNTIEVHGDGISDSGNLNFSSEIGMQSNTSGGAYEGLQITNNTIRVLNAQAADPQVVIGIWENGHGHTRNMTISGNQYYNMSPGNNPALNLQRAFRITSHSSATSTINYSYNIAAGANIGFQWLAGQNFAAHLPVRLTSNVIRNNATGVKVDSSGSANLSFNRIVGNSVAGVANATAGAVTAENNWWGCNYGPGAGGLGCVGTANGTTGTIDANPWLTLTTSASPNAITTGGTSAITSRMVINSDAVDTTSMGFVPNGTPATFSGTLGTVLPTNGTTTTGVTGTTFTAGPLAGAGSGNTTVDSQTVNAPITITFSCNNVSVPTGQTSPRNTQVLVPINVDDTTGRGIISFDYTFTFDPSVVLYLGTDQVGTLSSGMVITVNSITPGTLIVSGFTSTPLAGSGTLINLKFFTSGAIGTSTNLNLPAFQFNEGIPCVVTSNGDLTIISGTVAGKVTYANSVTEKPVVRTTLSGAGSVPVSTMSDLAGLYTLSGFGAGAYTVTPSKAGGQDVNSITAFDSALIAQHVVGLITLNSTQAIVADVSANSVVTSYDAALIAQWVVLIPNPGITGTWKFAPVNRAYANVETNQTNQNYSALLMGEVSGNWVPPVAFAEYYMSEKDEEKENMAGVGVTAPTLLGVPPSSALTIPLQVQNTTGQGIISYQYDLVYNPAVIMPTATPCSVAGTISASLIATCNVPSAGLLKVAVFGTMALNGAGVLMNLNFNVIGGAGTTSPLNLVDFMFNEGTPMSMTTNGLVSVAVPTAANSSISGRVLNLYQAGISGAQVTLTNNDGEVRAVRTNQFGHYRIEGLESGETYTISVFAKEHTFLARIVFLDEDITEFNFTSQE